MRDNWLEGSYAPCGGFAVLLPLNVTEGVAVAFAFLFELGIRCFTLYGPGSFATVTIHLQEKRK